MFFSIVLGLAAEHHAVAGAENTGMHAVQRPNVRDKRATTAGRQARAGENVPRTARPGLVACRLAIRLSEVLDEAATRRKPDSSSQVVIRMVMSSILAP